jgi:hypothetical protein
MMRGAKQLFDSRASDYEQYHAQGQGPRKCKKVVEAGVVVADSTEVVVTVL